jgi:hypothetical protein
VPTFADSRFLKAITPTTDQFLDYTVYYFELCYVIYYNLKFDVKIADNVLKIAILYKNVVLKLAEKLNKCININVYV